MNKKMLGIAMALLAVAMFVAPVMAEPTKGQKVTAKSMFIPPPTVRSEGESKMTEGGILVVKGRVEVYPKNKLFIGSDPPLTVFAYMVASGSLNTKTGVFVVHSDVVWYISTEGSPDGFSGNEELTLIDFNLDTGMWVSMKVHCVLQGFGAYAGQTLMLSYEGPASIFSYGYCLKG